MALLLDMVLPRIAAAFLAIATPSVGFSPVVAPIDPRIPAWKTLYKRPATPPGTDVSAKGDPMFVLGQRLFFDPRLSASGTLSCAACHRPDAAWSDHKTRAQGEGTKPLAFRAPTLLDVAANDRYGWTGRFADIEAVSFFAMTSPANMNLGEADILARVRSEPTYVTAFGATFPDGVSRHAIGLALTRFVSSITSGEAPFDRWIGGDEAAIGDGAKRGFVLFNGKARCAECHSGWAFTDGSFHDIGVATGADIGRGAFFKTSVKLQYAFKTPTLRDVADRGPYTHAGAITSLAGMIDLYDRGGIDRPSRAEAIGPLHLTSAEKADLLAFLDTLSGPSDFTRGLP